MSAGLIQATALATLRTLAPHAHLDDGSLASIHLANRHANYTRPHTLRAILFAITPLLAGHNAFTHA